MAQWLLALQEDLVASLATSLELVTLDTEDDTEGGTATSPLLSALPGSAEAPTAACALQLPRRVFADTQVCVRHVSQGPNCQCPAFAICVLAYIPQHRLWPPWTACDGVCKLHAWQFSQSSAWLSLKSQCLLSSQQIVCTQHARLSSNDDMLQFKFAVRGQWLATIYACGTFFRVNHTW